MWSAALSDVHSLDKGEVSSDFFFFFFMAWLYFNGERVNYSPKSGSVGFLSCSFFFFLMTN